MQSGHLGEVVVSSSRVRASTYSHVPVLRKEPWTCGRWCLPGLSTPVLVRTAQRTWPNLLRVGAVFPLSPPRLVRLYLYVEVPSNSGSELFRPLFALLSSRAACFIAVRLPRPVQQRHSPVRLQPASASGRYSYSWVLTSSASFWGLHRYPYRAAYGWGRGPPPPSFTTAPRQLA